MTRGLHFAVPGDENGGQVFRWRMLWVQYQARAWCLLDAVDDDRLRVVYSGAAGATARDYDTRHRTTGIDR